MKKNKKFTNNVIDKNKYAAKKGKFVKKNIKKNRKGGKK